MGNLRQLPNLGNVMVKRLEVVGVNDINTLMELGSKDAFERLRRYEGDTCFSALCALEGAIQNVRWHHLSKEMKADLKRYFDAFK